MLKESWTGERDVSLHLSKPVDDYLVDLLDKLDAVADIATSHADRAQQNYAVRYNVRARVKHFNEATGHACTQGPCTASRRRPSSSRSGCGLIACRRCSNRTWRNRSMNSWTWGSSDHQSVRWPFRSFAWPKKWRGTSGCVLSLVKLIYSC